MRASDALLLSGLACIAAAALLVALPLGLAVAGGELVAVAYLLERRAVTGTEEER